MKFELREKTRSGFTLVETLLYVSMTSVMVLVLSTFLFSILQSREKFQTVSEVDQQGTQILQLVTQSIRNAKKINTPLVGTFGESLSIDLNDAGKSPSVFNSAGTNFQVKEGVGAVISMTNHKMSLSGLSFSNVSGVNTPGIIRFQFTLTHINPSGREEQNYSKTFYGSASLRYN